MELIYNLDALIPVLWSAFGIFIILRYGAKLYKELLFDPLAGGNGKVQMDELAKAIILVVFIFCVRAEATRTTEYHVFSDAFYFALLLSVCAIASIKPLFQNLNHFRNDRNSQSATS